MNHSGGTLKSRAPVSYIWSHSESEAHFRLHAIVPTMFPRYGSDTLTKEVVEKVVDFLMGGDPTRWLGSK